MKCLNVIYTLLLASLATGCSKVLDKTRLDVINEKDVFNDIELATAYVDRIYARNLPGWSTEYADYSEESDGGGGYMYGQLNENSVNYWPYGDIRHINVLLAEIDKGTLKDADKKRMKSQAQFFRAYQ
jgi:starch-binding outer membrane protein, SusD/RagB family